MADITYNIVKEIAVLAEGAKGWTKELNLISWNDKEPKYDIREWSPKHEKMGKGVTLTTDELQKLRDALNGMVMESNKPEKRSNQPFKIDLGGLSEPAQMAIKIFSKRD